MQGNTALTPDELEAAHIVTAEVVEFDEDDDELTPTGMRNQLATGAELMKRTAVLLEFVSDPQLVEKLSKRERSIMAKAATSLWRFAQKTDSMVEEFDEAEEDE